MNAGDQKQQQERRILDEDGREGDSGDRLLDQAAHLLDHRQAVSGLHAGALEAIVEDGIFVDGDVECCSFAHDLDADVMRVAVGEQVVEVVDGTGEDAGDDGERHLRCRPATRSAEAAADACAGGLRRR